MIFKTFVLIFPLFAGIVSAHAVTEQSSVDLAELKKTVLDNDVALQKVAQAYQSLGYYMLGNATLTVTLRGMKPEFENLPTNLSVSDLDPSHQKIYGRMLMLRKFYPLYANVSLLTDSFKGNALLIAANKSIHHDTSSPNVQYILDKVKQTMAEEKEAFVDGRLEKANEKLNNHYLDLNDINSNSYWFNTKVGVELIRDRCAMPSSGCSEQERQVFDKFLEIDRRTRMREPIDDFSKMAGVMLMLKLHMEALDNVKAFLKVNTHLCFPELDFCQQ